MYEPANQVASATTKYGNAGLRIAQPLGQPCPVFQRLGTCLQDSRIAEQEYEIVVCGGGVDATSSWCTRGVSALEFCYYNQNDFSITPIANFTANGIST
jgi:hypothetical protein